MTGTAAGRPVNIQIAAGNLPRGIGLAIPTTASTEWSSTWQTMMSTRQPFATPWPGSTMASSPALRPTPITGKPFGAGPSENWYRPKAPPQSLAFEAAQPGHDGFYNKYAAYLAKVSDAYSFPFTDVCQAPQASLDPRPSRLDDHHRAGGPIARPRMHGWRLAIGYRSE